MARMPTMARKAGRPAISAALSAGPREEGGHRLQTRIKVQSAGVRSALLQQAPRGSR